MKRSTAGAHAILHPLAIMLALSSTLGCHPTQWDESDRLGGSAEMERFRPLGDFDVPGAEKYIGNGKTESEARLQLLGSVMDHVEHIRRILDTAVDWDDASARVIEVMNSTEVSAHEGWFVDQIGASMIIERVVEDLERRESVSAKAAIKSFVDVLVRRGSPNAPLIADGLELLRGYVSQDELRSIAARAAEDAGTYLDGCRSCGESASLSKSARPQELEESRLIEAGRRQLLELAGS